MANYLTLDDLEVSGKTVLVRVDINCPIENGKITDSGRIAASTPTIEELARKKAKVVVLAHQGRPGDEDCISLSDHATELQRILKRPVKFVPDVFGEAALTAIRALAPGEILMLENQRFNPEEMVEKTPEEHSKTQAVRNLSSVADFYVNDAFAAAHRSQLSLVGFAPVLPSAAGRLLDKEITNLSKLTNPARPTVFVFGGAKFADSAKVIETLLRNGTADSILLGGLTGLAYLKASGKPLGKAEELLAKEATPELYSKAAELLKKYGDRILLPIDFAAEADGKRVETDKLPQSHYLPDIGPKTVQLFKTKIGQAKTVFLSGPLGVFEKPLFATGTKAVFEAALRPGIFSVVGGGHSAAALEKLGLLSRVSYVSTGGGALEKFIMGKEMPVISALVAAKQMVQ